MRNNRVRSYTAADACWRRLVPLRTTRRHSANCVSMLRTAATRSGSSSSAPQCSHQARRSSSDGDCLPCSILETLDDSQPASSASLTAGRPASLRMSRRRIPKDARAWSAEVVKAGPGVPYGAYRA